LKTLNSFLKVLQFSHSLLVVKIKAWSSKIANRLLMPYCTAQVKSRWNFSWPQLLIETANDKKLNSKLFQQDLETPANSFPLE